MPGYILHLTAARMFLDRLPAESPLHTDLRMRDAFYIGNLLPDAVTPKTASHFYDPAFLDRMIVWPEPEKFRSKYSDRMDYPVFMGYCYHLYIDKKFLKEYLAGVAEYYGRDGQPESRKSQVDRVRLKRNGQRIPLDRYLSEEYYYGDYTRMNTWLCEQYQLPGDEELASTCSDVFDPLETEIEEAKGADLQKVFRQLREYRKVPAEAVNDLKVFDIEELLKFLEYAADEAIREF